MKIWKKYLGKETKVWPGEELSQHRLSLPADCIKYHLCINFDQ